MSNSNKCTETCWRCKYNKLQAFVEKWAEFEVNMGNSPGPMYTAGFAALASVIRAEAREVLPEEDLFFEVWHQGFAQGCELAKEDSNA